MSFFDEKIEVTLDEMLLGLSEALNLLDSRLTDHHKQVAYIVYIFGNELGLSKDHLRLAVRLALFHDIGAFKEEERNRLISFEEEEIEEHSAMGYAMLTQIGTFKDSAEIMLHHHTAFSVLESVDQLSRTQKKIVSLIHLADWISLKILTSDTNVLTLAGEISQDVLKRSGTRFNPQVVEILMRYQRNDVFWLRLSSDKKQRLLEEFLFEDREAINYETFMDITKIFVMAIDFRSRYTATHSIGVAAVAKRLAMMCDLKYSVAELIEIAGLYHDVGKLIVPTEVLEKPTELSLQEFDLIRQHPYFTYQILDVMKGLNLVRDISAYHHEQPAGYGYPFHLKGNQIEFETKLLAVADVFCALTEDRPYRLQETMEEVVTTMGSMVRKGQLDRGITEMVVKNAQALYDLNIFSHQQTMAMFEAIQDIKAVGLERLVLLTSPL